ncbi:hypothetical protein EVAR_93188_1 [Eumeta japonica]|uniref:Uncharacterized protein n=1 Tax=Eumeta variegata TaxID=151549 RepID=A0A4C1TXP2_EUMVA|nr:hypothetical protein EVAR_93188_1 [Eumeta japonica]
MSWSTWLEHGNGLARPKRYRTLRECKRKVIVPVVQICPASKIPGNLLTPPSDTIFLPKGSDGSLHPHRIYYYLLKVGARRGAGGGGAEEVTRVCRCHKSPNTGRLTSNNVVYLFIPTPLAPHLTSPNSSSPARLRLHNIVLSRDLDSEGAALALRGSEGCRDRRRHCADDVRDRRHNVPFDARYELFNLTRVENSPISPPAVEIQPIACNS